MNSLYFRRRDWPSIGSIGNSKRPIRFWITFVGSMVFRSVLKSWSITTIANLKTQMKIRTVTAKILFNNAKNTIASKKFSKANELSLAFLDFFVSFASFALPSNDIILNKSHV